jgi:Domain of unknown function (DUF4168)
MFILRRFCAKSSRILSRSLILATLTTTGVICTVVPKGQNEFVHLSVGSPALAENITPEEAIKYARALLEMEPVRQKAYHEIKQIIGGPPPNIVCHQPDSYSDLPDNAKEIATSFCDRSKKIVQNSGLSVGKFNAITMRAQSDQGIKSQIQNILLNLQK